MPIQSNDSINSILVIGLGRIGLPQSLVLADSGVKIYGFDHNHSTIESLKQGQCPFYEPTMEEYLKKNIGKNFLPISSWEEFNQYSSTVDAILFSVGTKVITSFDVQNETPLELTEHFKLLDKLFLNERKPKPGIKLLFRTTLPLGGTDRLKNYLENQHSLQEGKDFFLGFAPERLTEGNAIEELKKTPIIIGVYSEAAFEPIQNIFKNMGLKTIRVQSPLMAEFCKLTDNAFRNTIFAFANEIAMYADELGFNGEEVIDSVNNHYNRNNIPKPGFVSGYCLSKDPYLFELGFLKNKTKRDFQSIWYYSRKVNDYLIEYALIKILKHLKVPAHCTVAILGLSFNANVDDFRMSHALKIIGMLIQSGVTNFKVYDPYLNKNKYTQLPKPIVPYIKYQSNILNKSLFDDVDAIIICDKHQTLITANLNMELALLLENTNKPCYLFDGWGIWKEALNIPHIDYESIGFKK